MRGSLLSILLLAASPAYAQRAADREALRAFVDSVTVQTEGQVARFHEPVCVASEGLPADYNSVVEGRVRELAGAAGIRVASRAGCLPNLIVLVAEDSDGAIAALRRRRPDIFAGLAASDVRRVLAAETPVRTWQSSVARRAEGAPIADSRDSFLNQDVHLHHGVPVGMLRETTRQDLRLSVVLFDLAAIDGLSLMQIADHAAMRGLAPTRPADAAAGRSILALFDGAPASRRALPAVTRWDIAYLRALYRTEGGQSGSAHRGLLARLIAQALSATPR